MRMHHTPILEAIETIVGDIRSGNFANIYEELNQPGWSSSPQRFQSYPSNGLSSSLPPFSIGYPNGTVSPENGLEPPATGTDYPIPNGTSIADGDAPQTLINPGNSLGEYGNTRVSNRKDFYMRQRENYSCGPTSVTEALFDFQSSGGYSGINFDSASFANPAQREAARRAVVRYSHANPHGVNSVEGIAKIARHFGLEAQSHLGDTNLADLNAALAAGHGAIINVTNHYVYVSGMVNGQYIVGDPGDSHTTRWSARLMQHKLNHHDGTNTGFAEVWNPNTQPYESAVGTGYPEGTQGAGLGGGSESPGYMDSQPYMPTGGVGVLGSEYPAPAYSSSAGSYGSSAAGYGSPYAGYSSPYVGNSSPYAGNSSPYAGDSSAVNAEIARAGMNVGAKEGTHAACLKGVEDSLQSIGIDLPRKNFARDMVPILRKDPRFEEIPASQARPGDIAVYNSPQAIAKSSWGAGDIGIVEPNGKMAADCVRPALKGWGTPVVFRYVGAT